MMKVLFFLWKYQILKDPANLSYQTERFFRLSKKVQRGVLDKYFDKFHDVDGLEIYFDSKESRYFQDGHEITFFYHYYFDKKLIEYNVKTIGFIDKFSLDFEKRDYLIHYALELIEKNNLEVTAKDLVNYPDDLPDALSKDLSFMKYLVDQDEANIKYIVYNDICISRQRELIHYGIEKAKGKKFDMRKFLKNDGNLPKVLESNLDFLLYLIQNDISNVNYLEEKVLERQTSTGKREIVDSIIKSLDQNPAYLSELESINSLANILNKDEKFITYMIDLNFDHIRYIDWYNINDSVRERIIIYFTELLEKKNAHYDIMKYPARELFFQNYRFMCYLVNEDFRWIAVSRVNDVHENNQLIDLFFQKINDKKYKFRLEDFLENGKNLNHLLVENQKMLHYFFENKVPVVQYIDFFNLNSSKALVENILKEMENKNFEFSNDDFLVHGKYPIPLSNNYRFMRYVIDKNFNHLAYIDISMINKDELKRIINYAFRMVYYIRGNNKNLNFDLDGYFRGTPIFENEYFQECLESL